MLLIESKASVPAETVTGPSKVFAPLSNSVPVPAFVRPTPAPKVPEITAETVRSVAALVLSFTVNVRVAVPSESWPLTVEPRGLLVEVYVTPPPRVSVPPPVETLLVEVAVAVAPPRVSERTD